MMPERTQLGLLSSCCVGDRRRMTLPDTVTPAIRNQSVLPLAIGDQQHAGRTK